MNLIKALNWRYAVKRMTGERVPEEKVENILESIRLSASSMGLQPYNVLVIENEELRKQIQPIANNQPQVLECSHLIVFAAWKRINEEQVEDYIQNISKTREVAVENLEGFRKALLNIVNNRTPEQQLQWASRQTYIALGTAITAAAIEEVDATPMEGFDSTALDRLLNLEEKGLKSVTLLALGYRDTYQDKLAGTKKVRRDKEQLILQVA